MPCKPGSKHQEQPILPLGEDANLSGNVAVSRPLNSPKVSRFCSKKPETNFFAILSSDVVAASGL